MSENSLLAIAITYWASVQALTLVLRYRAAQKSADRKTAQEATRG